MATDQPNILLIMADDVGWFDVGAYHRGLMGTETTVADLATRGLLTMRRRPPAPMISASPCWSSQRPVCAEA